MKDELLFCPLGGSGEIGMNMNLFAYGKPDNQKWIIVDVGVTFADDTVPGVDIIYPDPGFIIDKKDDLLGIVLTHAHEDHIGAIAHVWPKLKCKIYATPFTAVLINEKFKDVVLISNKKNTGFSVANNQGIKIAKGENILLLNPDTVVQEDTLVKCLEFFDSHQDAGACRRVQGRGAQEDCEAP